MDRRAFLSRVVVVSTPLLAGCSGGGDGSSPTERPSPEPTDGSTPSPTEEPDGGSTPGPTEGPTPTPTPSPSPEPTGGPTPEPTATATAVPGAQDRFPDYEWEKLEGVDPVEDASIRMRNSTFRPLVAAVAPGTELTVTNADSHTHTFVVPGLGVSERLNGGDEISVTVAETGTFDYVCTFHPPGMLGRLVVTDDLSTPAPGSSPTAASASSPTVTPTPTGTPEDDGPY